MRLSTIDPASFLEELVGAHVVSDAAGWEATLEIGTAFGLANFPALILRRASPWCEIGLYLSRVECWLAIQVNRGWETDSELPDAITVEETIELCRRMMAISEAGADAVFPRKIKIGRSVVRFTSGKA
jgi:hypothetical protein